MTIRVLNLVGAVVVLAAMSSEQIERLTYAMGAEAGYTPEQMPAKADADRRSRPGGTPPQREYDQSRPGFWDR